MNHSPNKRADSESTSSQSQRTSSVASLTVHPGHLRDPNSSLLDREQGTDLISVELLSRTLDAMEARLRESEKKAMPYLSRTQEEHEQAVTGGNGDKEALNWSSKDGNRNNDVAKHLSFEESANEDSAARKSESDPSSLPFRHSAFSRAANQTSIAMELDGGGGMSVDSAQFWSHRLLQSVKTYHDDIEQRMDKVNSMNRSLATSSRQLVVVKQRMFRLKKENAELSVENSTLKNELRNHLVRAESLLRQLSETENSKNREAEARAEQQQAMCISLESENHRLKNMLQESEAYRANLRRDLMVTGAEISHVRQQVVSMAAGFEDQLKQVRHAADDKIAKTVSVLEDRLSRLSKVSLEAENRCADLKTRLQSLDRILRENEKERRDLREATLEYQQQLRSFEVQCGELRSQLTEAQVSATRFRDERDDSLRRALALQAVADEAHSRAEAGAAELIRLREDDSVRRLDLERIENRLKDVSSRFEKSQEALMHDNESLRHKLAESETEETRLLEGINKWKGLAGDYKSHVESLKRELRAVAGSVEQMRGHVASDHVRLLKEVSNLFSDVVPFSKSRIAEAHGSGGQEGDEDDPLINILLYLRHVKEGFKSKTAQEGLHRENVDKIHAYENILERIMLHFDIRGTPWEKIIESQRKAKEPLANLGASFAAEILNAFERELLAIGGRLRDMEKRYEKEIEEAILATSSTANGAASVRADSTSKPAAASSEPQHLLSSSNISSATGTDHHNHTLSSTHSSRPIPRNPRFSPEGEAASASASRSHSTRTRISESPPTSARGNVVEIHHHHHYDSGLNMVNPSASPNAVESSGDDHDGGGHSSSTGARPGVPAGYMQRATSPGQDGRSSNRLMRDQMIYSPESPILLADRGHNVSSSRSGEAAKYPLTAGSSRQDDKSTTPLHEILKSLTDAFTDRNMEMEEVAERFHRLMAERSAIGDDEATEERKVAARRVR
eukprot:ANDGO_02435.mRNA.1 hypothetical protein